MHTQSDSNGKKENSVDELFKNMLGTSTENSQVREDKLPNFNTQDVLALPASGAQSV